MKLDQGQGVRVVKGTSDARRNRKRAMPERSQDDLRRDLQRIDALLAAVRRKA